MNVSKHVFKILEFFSCVLIFEEAKLGVIYVVLVLEFQH